MRVITGTARGMRLDAPRGYDTRPTSDHVKESMFNIIQFDIEGRAALDLYCGTGQLGIEALSRGAASCVFVDNDRRAQEVVRKNLSKTKLDARASFSLSEAQAFLKRQKAHSFGLIFLDPPYGGELVTQALNLAARFDILVPGGIIVAECSKHDTFSEIEPPLVPLRSYEYGRTRIMTFTRA